MREKSTRLVFSANKYWFIGLEIERGVICDRGQQARAPRAPQARSVPRRAPLGPWYTRDARWGTTVNLRARGWSTESYIRGCDRESLHSHIRYPTLTGIILDERKKSRDRGSGSTTTTSYDRSTVHQRSDSPEDDHDNRECECQFYVSPIFTLIEKLKKD